MKKNTTVYYATVFILVLIFVVLLTLFFIDWFAASRQKTPVITSTPVVTPKSGDSAGVPYKNPNVIRSTSGSNVNYYVNGSFTYVPIYVNGVLRSMFIIDGDPNRKEIEVWLATAESAYQLGLFDDEAWQNSVWNTIKMPEILPYLENDLRAQLRITYPVSSENKVPPQSFAGTLKRLSEGDWSMPRYVSLRPWGVGVINN